MMEDKFNAVSNTAKLKKRVFSGVQPSGDVQLGNYLGAFKQWVQGQQEKENFFCIVDMHALTVYQEPAKLLEQTKMLAALLFASGIDPNRSTLFVQSQVTAHAEACWILNCMTPIGWLERMTQYKDKSLNQERVSVGLLDYPVLMAGDILLYDTNEVPVGEDQKQHVELSRDIAQRFNRIYGDTFVIPEPVIPEVGARIMGLDNPLIKMSKSHAHIKGHAIRLLDDDKEIERTIKRAVTDSDNVIQFSREPEKAGVNNLLGIYKVITGRTINQVESDFQDARGYGDLKARVSEVVIEELQPIKKKYSEIMDDSSELDRLLIRGAERARSYADPKLMDIKERVGLVLPGNLVK